MSSGEPGADEGQAGRRRCRRDEGDREMMLGSGRDAGGAANLRAQKTRTLLTALGIVFGVGSVIGMLAIGAGAREESLRFIEQLGVRNVLIDSRPATSQEELQQRRRSSHGLTERDVRILRGEHRGAGGAVAAADAASGADAAEAVGQHAGAVTGVRPPVRGDPQPAA